MIQDHDRDPGAKKIIAFENVSLNRNHNPVFSNLNLSVHRNEKVLLQGRSGIGKTTLFKLLLGFETVDNGSVTFDGHAIDAAHIKKIRQQIFYLSQDIDLKQEIVGSLIDEILLFNKKTIAARQLTALLSFLELGKTLLKQNVKALSGGERQRTGLLICFLLDRPVWLLDEPTSALDDAMKIKLAEYILAQNKTMVIISHDDVWKKNTSMRVERWV